MRNESAIEHIKTYKHNPNYLSSVEFDTLLLTSDINVAVAYADYIIFAIPSAFF
jgi:glycerol-3-phosphate dehydrogenase (NAD(P)+)